MTSRPTPEDKAGLEYGSKESDSVYRCSRFPAVAAVPAVAVRVGECPSVSRELPSNS